MSGASGGTPRRQVGDAPSPVIQAQSAVPKKGPKKNRVLEPGKNPSQRRRILLEGGCTPNCPLDPSNPEVFTSASTQGFTYDAANFSIYNDPAEGSISSHISTFTNKDSWQALADRTQNSPATFDEDYLYVEYKIHSWRDINTDGTTYSGPGVYLNLGCHGGASTGEATPWTNGAIGIAYLPPGAGGTSRWKALVPNSTNNWYLWDPVANAYYNDAPTAGDIIGYAIDFVARRLFVHINGQWMTNSTETYGGSPSEPATNGGFYGSYWGASYPNIYGFTKSLSFGLNSTNYADQQIRDFEIGSSCAGIYCPDGYVNIT